MCHPPFSSLALSAAAAGLRPSLCAAGGSSVRWAPLLPWIACHSLFSRESVCESEPAASWAGSSVSLSPRGSQATAVPTAAAPASQARRLSQRLRRTSAADSSRHGVAWKKSPLRVWARAEWVEPVEPGQCVWAGSASRVLWLWRQGLGGWLGLRSSGPGAAAVRMPRRAAAALGRTCESNAGRESEARAAG